jgi:hypothetical protein
MAKKEAAFDIDDAKSVTENIERLKQKLGEIDGQLGPILAKFLSDLTDEPNGDKSAMLDALRSALDVPIEKAVKEQKSDAEKPK